MSKDKNEIIEPIILDRSNCWERVGNTFKKSEYVFIQPIFGKSNTDQSYYEPRASSIANLYKSAGNAERMPLYDFNDELPKNGKDIDVVKANKILKSEHDKSRKVATLRGNKGIDVAEVSQLERNASNELEDSLTEQMQQVNQFEKDMRFVQLAKSRLDSGNNTTQENSENV